MKEVVLFRPLLQFEVEQSAEPGADRGSISSPSDQNFTAKNTVLSVVVNQERGECG
jgi:hypothetical protein